MTFVQDVPIEASSLVSITSSGALVVHKLEPPTGYQYMTTYEGGKRKRKLVPAKSALAAELNLYSSFGYE